MTQFNEITSNKIQKLIVILSKEAQSLRKEHIFCLHLILKEIQVLAGKFTIIRQPQSGFHINTISKAKDLPIERRKVYEFRSVQIQACIYYIVFQVLNIMYWYIHLIKISKIELWHAKGLFNANYIQKIILTFK